jgi:LPS O-antigen subunit length determinant protein (WzzB/FepE family)
MAQQPLSRPQPIPDADAHWRDLPAPAEDEINLFDLWLILRKRWRAMAALFAVVVLLALAYAVSMPQTHRYSAALEIGQVPRGGELMPLENADTVMTRLNQVLLPDQERAVIERTGADELDLDAEVSVSGNVVTLSGEGADTNADAYAAYLGGAMERLVAIHRDRLADMRKGIESNLQAVREQLESFQQAAGQPGAWEAAAGLRLRTAELEAQLAALEPTRVLSAPRASEEAVGPSTAVIVALAVVLGAMLAVFGAFMIEFVNRANAYARSQESVDH